MDGDFTIPMEYVSVTADELRSRGVDVRAWLEVADLTPEAMAVPDGLVDAASFRALVLEAVRLAREPGLGLFVGRRLGLTSHGIVGELAVHASNTAGAMAAMEQYSLLRTTLIRISHELIGDDLIQLHCESTVLIEEAVERPLMEAVLLSLKNVISEVTLGAHEIDFVSFPFAQPDYAPLAESLFDCPVVWGSGWIGFQAPVSMLETPLALADPSAFELAERICERQLDGMAAVDTLAGRVRRLMLLPGSGGFPTLEVAARQLHMHPRTLHRRLGDEGTSYRELTDTVRHGLALEHLRTGRFTLKELAFHLGYTDVANFRRAFKRWEGTTPSEFRERAAG